MFKGQETEELYFSTKIELKIDGMIYRPSICYKVPTLAKRSLEANKNVTFYSFPVRFVNGKVAASDSELATPVDSIIQEDTETGSTKKRRK